MFPKMETNQKEHLLALKVMRLTKPTLSSPIVVTCDNRDLPSNLLNNELKYDITSVSGLETLSSGQFLLVPQSFGNIYLGETFSSYVCVINDSNYTAKDVVVKAFLQTALHKISLTNSETNFQIPELSPKNIVDRVIHHEVKEIGTHILICEVGYINQLGQSSSFQKFFKFNVAKPLDVKTKFYNAESDEVLLETQVENVTTGPINLEKVSLESSPLFKVTSSLSPQEEKPGGLLLQPKESRQYLYCLAPVPNLPPSTLCGATNIGKLDMVWRSNLGEKGRLQTSALQRVVPEYGDIRLSIIQLPNIVKLEEPFNFTCKVINICKRSLDLILSLERIHSGLSWIGVSGRQIGALEPGVSITLELTMVAMSGGLQSISGIRLYDIFLKRTFEYDDLAQVFVTESDKTLTVTNY